MMPVAIGMGEGGEFYRPLAIAIIGGTITSTVLTLLVVPTFYDSIEIAHDRMLAKFRRRGERWNFRRRLRADLHRGHPGADLRALHLPLHHAPVHAAQGDRHREGGHPPSAALTPCRRAAVTAMA